VRQLQWRLPAVGGLFHVCTGLNQRLCRRRVATLGRPVQRRQPVAVGLVGVHVGRTSALHAVRENKGARQGLRGKSAGAGSGQLPLFATQGRYAVGIEKSSRAL